MPIAVVALLAVKGATLASASVFPSLLVGLIAIIVGAFIIRGLKYRM